MKRDGLTEKQHAFCREYIKDCNGTQAAIRAGYSEKTAYSQAEQLLRKLEIQESISRLRKSVEGKAIATYRRACERMSEIMEDDDLHVAVKACDRLSKLKGWDRPARTEVHDVTPPRYDLSKLSDKQLEQFEKLLEMVAT